MGHSPRNSIRVLLGSWLLFIAAMGAVAACDGPAGSSPDHPIYQQCAR